MKNTGTSPSQCSDAVNLGNILDFTYDYNLGVANNGEVKQIANNRNTSRTQNFTYDSLNRILTASTQATTGTYAWGLQFGYDIWGNLLTSSLTQGSAPILNVSADTNNRISGFCYDAAGNLLGQTAPPCPSPTYTYDAENRIKTTAQNTSTYGTSGTFNGQRAEAIVSLSTSVTTDDKGNVVSFTSTTTTAWFGIGEKNGGQFLGATQSSSTYNPNTQVETHSPSVSLDFGQATRVFGATAIAGAANVAARGHDALLHFPAAVAKDARAQPLNYALHVAGLALPFTGVATAAEGIITALEALKTSYDLQKEAHNP